MPANTQKRRGFTERVTSMSIRTYYVMFIALKIFFDVPDVIISFCSPPWFRPATAIHMIINVFLIFTAPTSDIFLLDVVVIGSFLFIFYYLLLAILLPVALFVFPKQIHSIGMITKFLYIKITPKVVYFNYELLAKISGFWDFAEVEIWYFISAILAYVLLVIAEKLVDQLKEEKKQRNQISMI